MCIKKLVGITLALLLQACVTAPKYTPMNDATSNAILDLKTYNLVFQDEVKPSIEISNVSGALGGGLIGAVIDSSVNDGRATTARDLLQPLYDEIEDVDYRLLLTQNLNPKLRSRFAITELNETAEAVMLIDKELNARIAQLKTGEALLFLTSSYQFNRQYKVLQTSTAAFLYLSKAGKGDVAKPDYHNIVGFQSQEVGQGDTSSIALWSANHASLFRDEMNRSVQATTEMLMYDMQTVLNEQCIEKASVQIFNNLGVAELKGTVVKTDSDATLFRAETGGLYTVAPSFVTQQKGKTCSGGEVK
jgi:hypothetical protein